MFTSYLYLPVLALALLVFVYLWRKDVACALGFTLVFSIVAYSSISFYWGALPKAKILFCCSLNLAPIAYAMFKGHLFRNLRLIRQPVFLLQFALAGALLFWMVFSGDKKYALYKGALFVVLVLVPLISLVSIGIPQNRKLFSISLQLGIVLALLCGAITLLDLGDITASRAGTEMQKKIYGIGAFSAITLARVLGIGVLMALLMLFLPKPSGIIEKIVYMGMALVALPVFVYLTFILGSRGPIFAAGVTMILTLALHRKSILLIVNSGVVAVVLMFAVFTFGGAIEEVAKNIPGATRIINTFKFGDETGSFDARLVHFEMAWNDAVKSGFIGVGTGSYGQSYSGPNSGLYDFQRAYPHNLFLEMLAEQGIVGFVLISAFCLVALRIVLFVFRSQASLTGEKIIASVVVYMFLNSLVSADLVGNYLFFAFTSLTALVAAATRREISHVRW